MTVDPIATPTMLQPNTLASLFSLLQEMTLVHRKNSEFEPSTRMHRLENGMLYGYLIAIALMAIAAFVQYTRPSQHLAMVLLLLYAMVLLCGLGFMLLTIVNVGNVFWRHRKQRFPELLTRLQQDMNGDAAFLARLLCYDKATLEYALLQYRHRWDIFDGRVGLLTGDLRKLGLFPAFAASAMAASTLLKSDINIYLWLPLILAACFYLVAFHAHGQRERPQQVATLLEYAIRHTKTHAEPGQETAIEEPRQRRQSRRGARQASAGVPQ
ncbi:hypothetical protein [Comamonas odontotermitis]|uniref:hypothetical protein n=1 Tax=Comamonas odontotermitis TaxID=379895 RepID=UPI0037501217